jgi:hypothetical protein
MSLRSGDFEVRTGSRSLTARAHLPKQRSSNTHVASSPENPGRFSGSTQDPSHRHARQPGHSGDVPQRATLPMHQLHVHPDLLSDHPLPPVGRSARSLGGRAYGVSVRGPGGAPDRGGLLTG